MSNPKLSLEILSGPLDGHVMTLETETSWSKEGEEALSFPWDEELGVPQARIFPEGGRWWLKGYDAPHGTYCISRGERIEEKAQVEDGDMLKASGTWMLVCKIE